jgi:hypothetical protein
VPDTHHYMRYDRVRLEDRSGAVHDIDGPFLRILWDDGDPAPDWVRYDQITTDDR